MKMGEVLMAEWFDIADKARAETWSWMHDHYLPALQATQGIAWAGHYEIVPHPDKP